MIAAIETHGSPLGPASARVDLRLQPLIIPIPKAEKLLGISRSTADGCVATGEQPTRHLGGRPYVVTAKLRELLESAS